MVQSITVTDQILDVIRQHPGCLLEEVVLACPTISWNQVFKEVDRLSRTGQIRLMQTGMGIYTVRLPSKKSAMRGMLENSAQ